MFSPQGIFPLPKKRRKPHWQWARGAGSHSPLSMGVKRGHRTPQEAELSSGRGRIRSAASPGGSWGHHAPGWAPPSPSPPCWNMQQDPRKTSCSLLPSKGSFSIHLSGKQRSFFSSKNPSQLLAWSRKFQHTWRLGKRSGIWAALGTNPSLKFPSGSLDPEGRRSGGAQHLLERGWWGTKGLIATSEGHGRRKTPPAWSQILLLDRCQEALSWPQLSPFHPRSLPDHPTELGLPKKAALNPALAFQMPPCHGDSASVTSWGWGQSEEAPLLPLPPLAGNSSPGIKG